MNINHTLLAATWNIFLVGAPLSLSAQQSSAPSHVWQRYLNDISQDEDFEKVDWEDYEQIFEDYAEHPLNINVLRREDWQHFPFLSAQQIEDIDAYLYRYGPMKSLGELAMIESLSWYQRQLLSCFVYAGEVKERGWPALGDLARYAKHEVVGAVKIPFYDRKGDEEGYLGPKYKHWLRYTMRSGEWVKVGLVASQDAGEPFFVGRNKAGYDFYSFYLQMKNIGILKNLTLGRYRLHFGQGLILNNDFSFGKLASLANMGRTSNAIRGHSSRYAANYLQGAAATLALGRHWEVSAFVSSRKIDATVKDGAIQTILTTGLHRTQGEMNKKDVATANLWGGHLEYAYRGFHVGATGFSASYSMPLKPNKKPLYKRYAPEGSGFWNVSMDYGYVSHRWNLAGETATGSCGGTVATVNTVSYLFSDYFSLMALQRFYPYRYYSLYANSFSEGSDVQDESGVYLGANWSPSNRWQVMVYTDVAYFAWPKYRTTGSTNSWDNLLDIAYRPWEKWRLAVRYRVKDKQGVLTQRGRVQAEYVAEAWSSRTQCDLTISEKAKRSRGWMVSEKLACRYKWLRASLYGAYFHTDDYDSRIYGNEPGLLYAMSFGSYYGEGLRCALLASANMGKHWMVVAKYGATHYFDRSSISTGLQQIDKSTQADLELQLKAKF